MSERKARGGAPTTVEQIAAAMAALGLYDGENTAEEHAEEAARLGGPDAYRVRMVNALLGVVQAEAAMADGVKLDEEAHHVAWEEQLKAAGAGLDDPVRRLEFIRWQVLRAGTPLRLMAQNREAGPIPLAAAHAATGLHLLLGVIAASQDAVATGDVGTLAAQAGQLEAAREALQNAMDNTNVLLNMLKSVGL
ncbi:DUF6245 family protein [Streptomyces sp. MBT33]|uniref:DUF6245 family protein n=1 Tax=Streptomyces sp. MBT33 TaxID=1488363 RepID=UPI00190AD025|nr:DUF6245 family protein [Streptomyces sp. MBT33]MBK3640122.1 hypothetical protein [Streptomyces sp. MBT33]